MLASMLAEKYSLSDIIKKMESEGWKVKDFSDKLHPEQSYRNWYYRIRKTHEISHIWLINDPDIWFYRKYEGTTK